MSAPVKYNTVNEEAILAAEAAKPSSAPDYWAKKSCRHCYGRGVTGFISIRVETNILRNEQLCDCAKKNFVKWRTKFCSDYVEAKKSPDPRI